MEQLWRTLVRGEAVGGVLDLYAGEESYALPGSISIRDGRVKVRVTVDLDSPLYSTFLPGMGVVIDGVIAHPLRLEQFGRFRSRFNSITLVQLGDPFPLGHRLGSPPEIEFEPRLTFFDRVDGLDWRKPIAAKFTADGLTEWMHDSYVTRSVEIDRTVLGKGISELALKTRDFDPINLALKNSEMSTEIASEVELQRYDEEDAVKLRFFSNFSLFRDCMSWNETLKFARFFQELLEINCWTDLQSSNLRVKLPHAGHDDGQSGWIKVRHKGWREPSARTATERRYNFIFPFGSLTGDSLDKWFTIREKYSHAFELFLQVLHSDLVSPEVQALELGAAFESLGYRIIAETFSKRRANNTNAEEFFNLVGGEALRLAPESFEGWAQKANDQYQAMKHLRRSLPPTEEIARVNDRSTLVFQVWLARQLGATDEAVESYIAGSSRARSSYARLPDPSELELKVSTGDQV